MMHPWDEPSADNILDGRPEWTYGVLSEGRSNPRDFELFWDGRRQYYARREVDAHLDMMIRMDWERQRMEASVATQARQIRAAQHHSETQLLLLS